MKMEKFKDERVTQQHRRITSGAYQLVSSFLLLSILYKQFILNEPFKAYMTEFIGFFGGSLYIVLGNIMKGDDVYNSNNIGAKKHEMRWFLLNSLVSSSAITLVLVMQNHTSYSENGVEIIIMFLIAFAFTLLTSLGLSWFSKKRADKITKQNEEEDN